MQALFLDITPTTPTFRGERVALYFKSDGLYFKKQYEPEVLVAQSLEAPWTTGDVKLTFKNTADVGWVMCNDGTIGNASSGGTTRANDDTEALFTLLWNNISDTYAPVSGGRGASAATDFAANKTLALAKSLGRAIAIAGAGSGLTARSLGETLGQETVSLTADQNGQHTHIQNAHTHIQDAHAHTVALATGTGTTHPLRGGGDGGGYVTQNATATNQNATATNQNSGNGDPHENMPPETFLNAMIKL